MGLLLPVVVGCLVAAGLYMMLRRSITKLLIGLALLSHGANLAIFTTGGLNRGDPPLIAENQTRLSGDYADPLPQALILTAIVISFGVLSFAITLVSRLYLEAGTDDQDQMTTTEN